MLPKKKRLHLKEDFDKVFKQGLCYSFVDFKFLVHRNSLDYNRFGIIVGKNVSKKAVVRNRTKRIIRHSLINSESILNIKGDFYDIIILVYPSFKVGIKSVTDLFKDNLQKTCVNITK